MNDTNLYRKVLKTTFFLCAAVALCRVTKGYFSVALVALGMYWAFSQQPGKALACYAFMPLLLMFNPYIVPKTAVFGWSFRLGPMLVGMMLAMMAMRRRGTHRIPLGAIYVYLVCAAVSSCTGWAPKISYLKIANFVLFMLGFWIGTQNLQNCPKDLEVVRIFFLSLAVLTVFGSACTLPFPAIAYPLDINMGVVLRDEGLDAANAYFQSQGAGMTLFAGITVHSQTLGPMLSCLFALVLADALFVECKFTKLHLALLGGMPFFLFMTRSRTAFFAFTVGLVMILWHIVPRIKMSAGLRKHVKNMAMAGGVLMVLGLGVAEVSNDTVSRWVRKTDDVMYDKRGLAEAVTETRMGLVENSLYEFRKNPLMGMGFQVNMESKDLYGNKKGLVLSAPVEKGLLPMMILGEGGIVGVIAFIVFLCAFYSKCYHRKYMVTIAMFTTFLATNMGEATFFSPGGGGGIIWMLTAVGGFCTDMMILVRNRYEMQWGAPVFFGNRV